MLAGHLAVGLAFKARYRNVPTWALLVAAQLLDGLWMVLTFLQVEHFRLFFTLQGELRAEIYDAPYSHSLFWSAFYALVVFLLFVRADGQRHWAVPLSLVLFSHWILDCLVAEATLPFANFGPALQFGMSLANMFPFADFLVEAIVVLLGWWVYDHKLRATKGWERWGVLAVLLILLIIPVALGRFP